MVHTSYSFKDDTNSYATRHNGDEKKKKKNRKTIAEKCI